MQNLNQIFLTKLIIFFAAILQSFNCQADTGKLNLADSLFSQQSYQEAYIIYQDLLENEAVFSPAMLLKMAFVAEGMGDYSKASFYLAKYYDQNPNPRVITKIKTLTEQSNLKGYELSDLDRLKNFLSDFQSEITAFFSLLLIISIIFLIKYRQKADSSKYYLPAVLFLMLAFMSNNFLYGPKTGIVTGTPTLIMDQPTAGGELLDIVDPGHRIIVKSIKDIWYEVKWGNQTAYIKKEHVTRL
nr:hypothetical protein [Cecembia sp.]